MINIYNLFLLALFRKLEISLRLLYDFDKKVHIHILKGVKSHIIFGYVVGW